MRLEPGPLQPLPETAPATEIEPGGFGDLARAEMLQGATWENTLDTLAATPALYVTENPGTRLAPFIDPALAFANELAAEDPTAGFDQLNADALTVDGAVLSGYGNVPAEAWQQLPSNLRQQVYDTIPPQPGQIVGAIGLPTNMSSQTFAVGGPFRITIQVTPRSGSNEEFANLRVEANVYLRPDSPYTLQLGYTNAAGQLTYNGTWPANALGDWYMGVIVWGSIGVNGPQFQFVVGAAGSGGSGGGGGTQYPVSVTISNLVTGSKTIFKVGQDFTLTVKGAPNSDIAVSIWFPGGAFSTGYLGRTDATGRFDYTGRFAMSDLGHYTENYTVGGVLWGNSLIFDVVP